MRQTKTSRFPRTARVNAVLREVVAEELERIGDHDERLKLATVTAVESDPDLRHARVYMASISEEVAVALEEHRWRLQSAIGRQVRMKRTPALDFAPDPAVAAGARIDDVLRHNREGR